MMAPTWGAGPRPKHRRKPGRVSWWSVFIGCALALAISYALAYLWPSCGDVGAPWWCV